MHVLWERRKKPVVIHSCMSWNIENHFILCKFNLKKILVAFSKHTKKIRVCSSSIMVEIHNTSSHANTLRAWCLNCTFCTQNFCMYQCLFQFSIHLFRLFFFLSSCCSFLSFVYFWWLCRRSSFEDFIAYTTMPSGSRGFLRRFLRYRPLQIQQNFSINWILCCSLQIH